LLQQRRSNPRSLPLLDRHQITDIV
jgi:hypothetical protein